MILYSSWIQLPLPTRHIIASHFNITKRGPTEVFDNQIKSDGYAVKEIESALSMEAMQKFTGSTLTDMLELWNLTLLKVNDPDGYAEKITLAEKQNEPKVELPKKKQLVATDKKRAKKPKAK
jgi:hypothetical protein